MPITRAQNLVSADLDAVNKLIIAKIHSEIGLIDKLSQHIMASGGKRLRPLLVLLASHACGYKGKKHINVATMIEFFHTATLLHDDVVDDSTLRRGRKTANKIWGSKASILVGDYLFTQFFKLMISVNNPKILRLLADTSHNISSGEIKQLTNRYNVQITLGDYFEVIRAKTADLFAASTTIGALLSKAPVAIEKSLYTYGLHLGNAFQLIDDALDYCSDPETMGKNIGDDLADGKATLPLIYALKHGSNAQKELITESIKKGEKERMPDIFSAIVETKAIEFTKKLAKREVQRALTALKVLPDSDYKKALADIAYFALERKH